MSESNERYRPHEFQPLAARTHSDERSDTTPSIFNITLNENHFSKPTNNSKSSKSGNDSQVVPARSCFKPVSGTVTLVSGIIAVCTFAAIGGLEVAIHRFPGSAAHKAATGLWRNTLFEPINHHVSLGNLHFNSDLITVAALATMVCFVAGCSYFISPRRADEAKDDLVAVNLEKGDEAQAHLISFGPETPPLGDSEHTDEEGESSDEEEAERSVDTSNLQTVRLLT